MQVQQGVNLIHRIEMGVQSLVNSLDEEQGFLPIFYYWLLKEPPYGQHSEWDVPHQVCRTLDAILLADFVAGIPVDINIVTRLSNLLYNCFSHGDGLPWRPPVPASYIWYRTPSCSSPPLVYFHDIKETFLALTRIYMSKKDVMTLNLARNLCHNIAKLSAGYNGFKSFAYGEDGWIEPDEASKTLLSPTFTSGRSIMGIIEYYQFTKDLCALKLAKEFADLSLKTCFTEDGNLTDEAGIHVHSITGTLASLVRFGLLMNERHYMEIGRRIYDVGLKPYRSSFGWVKENVQNEANEGEICCTADLIDTALLLGEAGYPKYYEDAERMIRNHLLNCQLLDVSWIKEARELPSENGKVYRQLLNRVKGSFAGWCLPNDFSSGRMPEIQMCCTAHAVHVLCKVFKNVATIDENGVKVNLLFTKDTDYLTLKSYIPVKGRLELQLHTTAPLFVRKPSWLEKDELEVRMFGRKIKFAIKNPYIYIPKANSNTNVEIEFPQKKRTLQETIIGKTFTSKWTGDTLISIKPKGKRIPLYNEISKSITR